MMRLILILLMALLVTRSHAVTCSGKFLNPITDICWRCIFPMRIAGIKVMGGDLADPSPLKSLLCFCKRPLIPAPVPGIPISFFEPARLVDVTRTPYCLVNMGGIKIMETGVKGRGTVKRTGGGSKNSFYNVHWYVYPILHVLEVLTDFVCLEANSIDVAYLSELDPFWSDDAKGSIINPEAILFGNPIAQAACAADCLAATARYPLDLLFWCSGCQGSLYPFGGTVGSHTGGIQASLLVAGRMMAKLHRQGLLWGYIGKKGLCGKYPMPIIKKSQYRTQMTYPISQTTQCQPLGASAILWQAGREYPYKGEDFGYLIWRKRDCCLL